MHTLLPLNHMDSNQARGNCVYICGLKQTFAELPTQDLSHLQLLSSGRAPQLSGEASATFPML